MPNPWDFIAKDPNAVPKPDPDWAKKLAEYEKELARYAEELARKEKELIAKEEALKKQPIMIRDADVPFIVIPSFLCPECKCQMSTISLPDALRVKIEHGEFINCSRSLTYIIRPIAQFTQTV